MTNLQPPVGTTIETQEEAIRVLLSPEYVEFTTTAWKQELADVSGRIVTFKDIKNGLCLPYRVIGIAEGYTPDPNYGKTKMVEVPADTPTDGMFEFEGKEYLTFGDFMPYINHEQMRIEAKDYHSETLFVPDYDEQLSSFYHAQRDAQLKANTPTTARWLDAGDAAAHRAFVGDETIISVYEGRHILLKAFYDEDDGEAYFNIQENINVLGVEDIQKFKPLSWILNPKSPEAQADAKRFAGVKTWEGGEDE